MLSEGNNILEFNQYTKSDKVPHIIYVDIEALIKTIDGCANNSKNEQIGEYIPRRYSTSSMWVFDHIENIHTLSRGKRFYEKVL